MTKIFKENNDLLIKHISLLVIIISWFIYTGIGFNFIGTPLDISKISILGIIFLFIYSKPNFEINNLDKIFFLYIISQLLFSIYYINFYKQFLYLLYYILFYYSSYFISRVIFDKNNVFDYFIKYISYSVVVFFPLMIFSHINNIYFFDTYRVAYNNDILEHSHAYIRTFNGIDLGKTFVGQFLSPNTISQFIGILMVVLIPYFLWKVNKNNILLFITTSILLLIGLEMTQARQGLVIIFMQFVILLILRYKNSIKATMIFVSLLFILWIINENIILYNFYLLTDLNIYVNQMGTIVNSVSSVNSDRVYYYLLFFEYVMSNSLNFLFGYGPVAHEFHSNIIGITDLAWVFNTFIQVGLISILIYTIFYMGILKKILKNYEINGTEYKEQLKYVIAVFMGMAIVSIPTYQAILNPMYFFIIGGIVSLIYNKSYIVAKDKV